MSVRGSQASTDERHTQTYPRGWLRMFLSLGVSAKHKRNVMGSKLDCDEFIMHGNCKAKCEIAFCMKSKKRNVQWERSQPASALALHGESGHLSCHLPTAAAADLDFFSGRVQGAS